MIICLYIGHYDFRSQRGAQVGMAPSLNHCAALSLTITGSLLWQAELTFIHIRPIDINNLN